MGSQGGQCTCGYRLDEATGIAVLSHIMLHLPRQAAKVLSHARILDHESQDLIQ
jgi:hypothetical protein